MQHEIRMFRPHPGGYNNFGGNADGFALGLFIFGMICQSFTWFLGFPIGLISIIVTIMLPSLMFYLSHTHVEKSLDPYGRKTWHKYNKLPPEVRAKIALDIPTLARISSDIEQFRELDYEIDMLSLEYDRRKQAEARLDPTAAVTIEALRAATEEEKQYTTEIRKVLGDFDKTEIPHERLRLIEKMRARLA